MSTEAEWTEWARAPFPIGSAADPGVRAMPAMLRRRAGTLGKMALEVAYACLEGRSGVPTVFCSRHGEVARALELLSELARDEPLSPIGFSMAVHNASAGLFSIARAERANHIALAAGASTVEHAVIEAYGLLADGEQAVMLVACDSPLPAPFSPFEDCAEQAHAFAWLMVAPAEDALSLSWQADHLSAASAGLPGSLDLLRFQLSGQAAFERVANQRRWRWSRGA